MRTLLIAATLLTTLATVALAQTPPPEPGGGGPVTGPPAEIAPNPYAPDAATDPASQPATAPGPGTPAPGAATTPPAGPSGPAPGAADVAASADVAPPAGRVGVPLVHEDITPTLPVIRTADASLMFGALIQVHFAPWMGSDALIANGDPATRAGFRMRRARFGLDGHVGKVGVLLNIDPLQTDKDTGALYDAKLSYELASYLSVSVGSGKVPFSRAALQSSRRIAGIERPLSVTELVPERRLGLVAGGTVWEDRIGYLAGILNASPGFKPGNDLGGFLYGARLDVAPLGARPDPLERRTAVAIGGGALAEQSPGVTGIAVNLDVLATFAGASLQLEALCDRRAPTDTPVTSPSLPDETTRCGAYVEAGYLLPFHDLQPMARLELFDDNRAYDDTGDVLVIEAGLNGRLPNDHARAQIHYLHRVERHGAERANDGLVLSVEGWF